MITKIKKNFDNIAIVMAFVGVFIITFSFFADVKGGVTDNVSGFAWESDNWTDKNSNGVLDLGELMVSPGGAGWISFNCTSDTCVDSNYGVNLNQIDANTMEMVGYAWSSSYGWLKFGGLSGFPVGGGTVADNVKVYLNEGSANARPVKGWARFCSVFENGCSGALKSNNLLGGWDGWVSFSGTSPNYGVFLNTTLNPNEFSGYAWGGNSGSGNIGKNVVGWISFNCISGGNCGTSNYKVVYNLPSSPAVDLSVTPINSNSFTLSWVGSNLASGNSCTAGGNNVTGWQTGSTHPSSGSSVLNNLPDGQYTFSITCLGSNGTNVSDSVNVFAGAGIDLNAFPPNVTGSPYTTQITWDAVPTGLPNGSLTNCVGTATDMANSPISIPEWNNFIFPSFPINGSGGVVSNIPIPNQDIRFTLTCTYNGSTISGSTDVLYRPSTYVVLTNSQVTGTHPNYLTNITISTSNTIPNTCVATLGGSNWPGSKNNPNTGSITQNNVIVPPNGNTVYSIRCQTPTTPTCTTGPCYTEASLTLNRSSSAKTKPRYIEN